ncbi:MAG TPA: histone deacetylase, partial [Myxococcota bacterium]|nr:histone deacetylase [Myxococcota bacterium]
AGLGYTVNAPLPPGLGDGDYCRIFEETLIPVAHAYKPDIVLISAGFDAHRDDPLGDQRVSDEGFAALTGIVSRLADEVCDGRLVMLLEGGYDLRALGRSVRACVDVLGGSTA